MQRDIQEILKEAIDHYVLGYDQTKYKAIECKLCSALIEGKKINWLVRSTFADDNIGEILQSSPEFRGFDLTGYKIDNNVYVSAGYREEYEQLVDGEDVIISPFSEGVQFNYCPVCGDQISETLKSFEELRHFEIEGAEDE